MITPLFSHVRKYLLSLPTYNEAVTLATEDEGILYRSSVDHRKVFIVWKLRYGYKLQALNWDL